MWHTQQKKLLQIFVNMHTYKTSRTHDGDGEWYVHIAEWRTVSEESSGMCDPL